MEETIRVRTPKGKEIIGTVEEALGASRFKVFCLDDKERVCRIPGKFRKIIFVRQGDFVLVEPWDIEPNEKGDIIFRYKPSHVHWLRKKGFIK